MALELAAGDPLVLAGDFNVRPLSPVYNDLAGLFSSAYATACGREPDFTCYAQTRNQAVFVDTLDYVWCRGVAVRGVVPLPGRLAVDGPLPNSDEPSDHLLIGATLDIE